MDSGEADGTSGVAVGESTGVLEAELSGVGESPGIGDPGVAEGPLFESRSEGSGVAEAGGGATTAISRF